MKRGRNTGNRGRSTGSRGRSTGGDFRRRRKYCRFTAEGIEYIDYKDVQLLQRSTLENGKIISRRISGTSARHQRMLTQAIKRARHLALLPFVNN